MGYAPHRNAAWPAVKLARFLTHKRSAIRPSSRPDDIFTLYSVPAYEQGVPEQVSGREIGSAKQRVAPGDVLICKINPRINRAWVVSDSGDKVIASTEWIVLASSDEIDPRYLRYFLTREQIRQFLASNVSGVGGSLMRVRASTVGEIEIPLPPIRMQRDVVAQLDELFGEIEAADQELAAAKADLARYRRAVLKAAVTGELTRDWRAKAKPAESGANLVARVGSQDVQRGRRRPSSALDVDRLPVLPEGWAWATMAQVTDLVGGLTVDAKRSGDDLVEVPYLRVANVQRGRLDLSVVKTIRAPADKVRALQLYPNDILLNEGGDRDKVGRGWVWDGQLPLCIHQNHVFRARPKSNEIDPRFVSHYCNEMGRDYFLQESKQTTNLASLSMGKVASLPIPIPPANEQRRIVAILSAALDAADEIDNAIVAAQHDSQKTRQALLANAFSGRLERRRTAPPRATAA